MRLILFILLGGGFLCFSGYQKYLVNSKTQETPSTIKLAGLESGGEISNNYLTLDEHWALYGAAVYYTRTKYNKEVKESTTVDYTYYPALSLQHPYMVKLTSLQERYGELSKVPDSEFPQLDTIDILIKTKKFKTVGDIPKFIDTKKDMTGLVINSINSLNNNERRLIKQSFPKINFNKIVIIEEDRKPSSTMTSFAMMGGGVFIILAGLLFAVKVRP